MTNSILTPDTTNTNTNTQQDNPDDKTNYLELLVGENKKYKDVNILAKSALDKDSFIEQLKSELTGLRSELDTRMTLEAYLDKMGNATTSQNTNENSQSNQNENNRGENIQQNTVNPEDIEKLLERKLSERDQQSIQRQNVAEVKNKLVATFGQNYLPKLRETAESLGVSPEELDQLAANKPSMFYRLVGIDSQNSKPNSVFVPPNGGGTQMGSGKTDSVERTRSYYNDIKKQDAKTYWSPAVQNQLHKDALRLGEKFFD